MTGCQDGAGPTTGAARVTVTTTGIDLDADGYIVTVDGEPGRAVAPVDAITLHEIPTGAHTVALGGLAVNCVVGGENPRTVSVAAGSTAEVAFAVACVADVGSLHVTTATTGVDLDPDGYAVSVDGGAGQAVGGSGTLTLSDLRSGEHLVRLDGLASNCAVSDASPRPVTVAFGATAEVAFAVACVADVGSLRVTTASTGLDLDGDGYTVRVDGHLVAGHVSRLTLTVSHDDTPVTDLQPYLGAYGHLVALRAGDLGYLHVHPQETTTAGPAITFDVEVPTAGAYRLFLNFQHDGVVRTAGFTATAS